MDKFVKKINTPLSATITLPSDKSISHRAIILSALANGKSIIKNLSLAQDPQSTLQVCAALGLDYNLSGTTLMVNSTGCLTAPTHPLNCGNSGTTMRLMSGVLAGQNFNSTLIGDQSLSARPMKRIIEPLTLMGANISSNENKAPLTIQGQELHGIDYTSPLASAQVKSAILLAGLFATVKTTVTEPYQSRNHTELILSAMGANITTQNNTTTIQKSELKPLEIEISGDISSAAYFIAATLLIPNSELIIKNVGLNPTRTGILDILKKMNANIEILDKKTVCNEITGDIKITYSELKSCEISGEIIPRLIDEIPIIALIATQATGTTTIKDAQDLRNKESDRIKATVSELQKLGANIQETQDGMIIHGKTPLIGGVDVETYKDHRLAMSLYVAGLICQKEICIKGFEWVNISFPEFEKIFGEITQ